MTEHTPGPWDAANPGDYADFDGNSIVICGDDKRIIVVQGSDDEAKANANLVVVAPILLAALNEVLGCARLMASALNTKFADGALDRADALIAKATSK